MQRIIIYVLISLILAVGYMIKEKRICNPITIICGLWSVIMFLSSLELFTLYHTSPTSYDCIFLGVISFVFGYHLIFLISAGRIECIKFHIPKKIYFDSEYDLNYRRSYFFAALCIVMLSYSFFRYRAVIVRSGFSLSAIQAYLYSEESRIHQLSGILNAISFLVSAPMMIVIEVTTAVEIWGGKGNKKLVIMCILIVLGRIITSGGRQAVIQFMLFNIIAFSCSSINLRKRISHFMWDVSKKNIKRQKKKFLWILGVLSVVILITTLSRTKNLWRHLYPDFAMQPYMFEHWANEVNSKKLRGNGLASWIGFSYSLFYIIKNLFRISMPDIILSTYQMTERVISEWVMIGSTLRANAYVSIFWYFYYDARVFGIFIGMFILGWISHHVYYYAINYPSKINIAMYAMIGTLLFYSYGDLEIAKPAFALAILYVRFFLYKRRKVGSIRFDLSKNRKESEI